MLEKYRNNESHFVIRFVAFLSIVLGFVLFSALCVEDDQRSCLGPPDVLPFVFIGFPVITFLLVLDLIVLGVLKVLNWEKVLVNSCLFLSMVFYFILVFS